MSKKWLLLIFLIIVPIVLAEEFDVSVPDAILAIDGKATIPLTITNLQPFNDDYIISAADFNWLVESIDNANISQGQTKVVNVNLKNTNPEIKSYGVKIKVKSISGKEIEKIARIDVKDLSDVFDIRVVGPDFIDPRKESNKVTLEFENNYDNNFNLNVILTSGAFTETKVISLSPREILREDFLLKLPADTKEGDLDTNALFYQDNSLVANQTIILKIIWYQGVREVVTEKDSVLYHQEIIKKINDGNAVGIQKYVKGFTFTEKLFTSFDPKPDSIIKSDDEYILTWDIRLDPGQEQEIKITTNYRTSLIIFVVLLALLILSYTRYKKDIIVSKKGIMIIKEKGFSQMKVSITLYNRGNKTINNIKIMERIPNMTKEDIDFHILQPIRITHGIGALSVVWKLDELVAKQEKTITYDISSKLHSMGRMALPPTLVKYIKDLRPFVSQSTGFKLLK
ncbi:hypothetical protein J4404_02095 [Candidatus Woesearchaeota archaeon]|nr:hypothetical protein [Candidatus Woesearchaeota archaeon]